jgi:hypothetical protein
MPNSVGQSTDNDKAGLCLFGMKFTAVKRRKTTKDVIVVCEGTSPQSSAVLQRFQLSTALLQTVNAKQCATIN